jgi:glycosyltransferase involved in cell wall biosynthesis
MKNQKEKIAIVHDYFNQFGGAEKTVEGWLEQYPTAVIYTSIFIKDKFVSSKNIMKAFDEGRIKTTFINKLFTNFGFVKFFKHFFWLYPIVMSFVVVKNFERVLISSSYCAKNIRVKNVDQIVVYSHSPTRYLHSLDRETEAKTIPRIFRVFIPLFTFWLKWMDLRAVKYLKSKDAQFVTNSLYMQQTHRDIYNVESVVIYPPVNVDNFLKIEKKVDPSDQFLYYFGRISSHKKIDILMEAALMASKNLYICGSAAFELENKKLADLKKSLEEKYPNSKGKIVFLGRLENSERNDYLSRCKAFVFAGKEDFGIAPIEALASSTPIIMYKAGGALDYLVDGKNGLFANIQSADCFAKVFEKVDEFEFDKSVIQDSAKRFDLQSHLKQIEALFLTK